MAEILFARLDEITSIAQPLDPTLTAFAALAGSADKLPYFTGPDAFALTDLTAFSRTALGQVDAAGWKSTLGLTIGTNVQAWDAGLDVLAGFGAPAGIVAVTGTDAFAKRTITGTAAEISVANGDGSANPIISLPAALTFTGKTITGGTYASVVSLNKITFTAPATAATLTLVDGTTVTGPASSGTLMTLGNNETVTGVKTFGAAGNVGKLSIAGNTSGATVLNASAVASGTLTLPAATDTLVARNTTDTLTNKTIDNSNTGTFRDDRFTLQGSGDQTKQVVFEVDTISTGTTRTFTFPNVSTAFVGTDATQTLTNKTLTAPVISTITNTGTITLPTATTTLMGRDTTDTMTNKTFNSAGTGNVLQVSGVTVSRGQFPATNTNDDATAGNIGDFVSTNIPSGSAVSMTSGVISNIATVSLANGDWDVSANIDTNTGATTDVTQILAWISTTSATLPSAPNAGAFSAANYPAAGHIGFNDHFPVGMTRISVTGGPITVYLSARSNFSVSTQQIYGYLRARRPR